MKKLVLIFICVIVSTCSLLGQRTIFGGNNKKLVLSGGYLRDYSSIGTYLLQGGSVNLKNNSTYNHKNRILDIRGSWISTTGSIDVFTTTGNDTISGSSAPVFFKANFSNGTNNSTAITNTSGIFIDSNLIFNNGITTTVRSNHHTGAIHFNTNANYIGAEGDSRHVNGYVGKKGAEAFTFPVGSGTDYRPLSISAPTNTADINVAWLSGDPGATAQTFDGVKHPVISIGDGLLSVATAGQWEFIAPTAASNSLTITVSIPDMTAFTTASRLRLAGWNGLQWINLSGKDSIASGNTQNSTLSGIIPAGGGNITSFAVGSASRALPVIINFYGILYNCSAILQWTTITDLNGDHQDIEFSTDGTVYKKVGTIVSHNIATGSAYTFTEKSLVEGNNYFRIKLVNKDGQFSYSDVQVLNNHCVVTPNITISPNPATDHIIISGLTGVNNIVVYNAYGTQMSSTISSTNTQQMLVNRYPQGIYFVHITDGYGTKTNLSFLIK